MWPISALLERRGHSEVDIFCDRSLRQDLVAIDHPLWGDDVLTERVTQGQRVRRGLDSGGVDGLDSGCVFENVDALLRISGQLVVVQTESSKTRHMRNVDVDGHGPGVYPLPQLAKPALSRPAGTLT